MIFSVYTLVCPITEEVRYVGLSHNLKLRYLAHTSSPSKHLKEWVNELKSVGKKPIMKEIEKIDVPCEKDDKPWYLINNENLVERELFWIKHYHKNGARLLNRNGVTISINTRFLSRPPKWKNKS